MAAICSSLRRLTWVLIPPVPPYYQRYFAGEDLLVIDTRANAIVVIIPDIWR